MLDRDIEIAEAFELWLNARTVEFGIEDALAALPEGKFPQRLVEDHLEDSTLLFFRQEGTARRYLPRGAFFNGKTFLVKPSPWEIERGVLVPGHRFMPFCSSDNYPSDIEVSLDGRRVRTQSLAKELEELYQFHYLLGGESILDYFIAEDPGNRAAMAQHDAAKKIKLIVLDLKDFYHANHFATGGQLRFAVVDWAAGAVRLEGVAGAASEEDADTWVEALEDALVEIFDRDGPYLDIPEQLSRAFFVGGAALFANPPLGVEEFLHLSQRVHTRYFGGNSILWRPEEPLEDSGAAESPLAISRGKTDSLSELLAEAGGGLSPAELEARLRDSFQAGDEGPTEALVKLRRVFAFKFQDEAQEICFLNLVDELWELMMETGAGEDEALTRLRGEALKALDAAYAWRRRLPAAGAPDDELTLFERTLAELVELLDAMGRGPCDDELAGLEESLRSLAKQLAEIINRIEGQLQSRKQDKKTGQP